MGRWVMRLSPPTEPAFPLTACHSNSNRIHGRMDYCSLLQPRGHRQHSMQLLRNSQATKAGDPGWLPRVWPQRRGPLLLPAGQSICVGNRQVSLSDDSQ